MFKSFLIAPVVEVEDEATDLFETHGEALERLNEAHEAAFARLLYGIYGRLEDGEIEHIQDCESAEVAAKQLSKIICAPIEPSADAKDHPNPAFLAVRAVRDYHYALDTRQHGGIAADRVVRVVSAALNLCWTQGAEANARKDQA